MGLTPVGEGREQPSGDNLVTGGDSLGVTTQMRVQVAFLVGGCSVGIMGAVLPHADAFMADALIVFNLALIASGGIFWWLAPRMTTTLVRLTPAVGTLTVSGGVLLSRDPTSAYALLYLIPAIYAYYFLRPGDAVWHILFSIANYAAVILILGVGSGVTTGSVAQHFVITVGNLIVVGAMLAYLRRRVAGLMDEVISSTRTDLTTGLLNARGLDEVLDAELERARMGAHRTVLLDVKLTGLRQARVASGGEAANRIIDGLGQLLDDSTRRVDTVAKIGADEFAVLVPETNEHTGFLLAEQILARLRRHFRADDLHLSAAIGVASFPKHGAQAEALMRAAGAAAEAAQALGGGRAVVYSSEIDEIAGLHPAQGLSERRAHLSTVLSLAEVLDLRDPRTASHSQAVARLCELIGTDMELPAARVQRLRLAGLLHDIGKVGVPDTILGKPGPLSPAEWDQVRHHPEMAARVLSARELTDIREWILARHEQPDGHGYPRGISGEAIPIESRILAVAESYDAMTNERPYRPAMSRAEAIAELGRYAGSQFDGSVVDSLVRVLDRAGAGVAGA